MHYIILLIISFNFFALHGQNTYKIIYEADSEGKIITGDLEHLLNYVQNGNPIRVGWVLNFEHPKTGELVEMQHWAVAGFITTLNGHVFAQIHSIYQQGPSLNNPPAVFLANNKPNGWVAILGTTGIMRQKYTRDENDIATMKKSGLTQEDIDTQLKSNETMNVRTMWAASQK